ncbi:MAG: hypothetical protein DRO67_01960 [Candidatus Asgardarchaeum californiense]|nr:MAG: hypothetical protein DRO67_01960 [Candidatus Asgardarchaeum californiense]
MISTEEINRKTNEMYCKALGVDKFVVDYTAQMMREPDRTVFTRDTLLWSEESKEQHFYCPVVHWWINGNKFSAAVPIHLKEIQTSCFLGSSIHYELDIERMTPELIKLVEESKQIVRRQNEC